MSRLNVANFRHPDGTVDNINLDSSGRVLIGASSVGNANADELTLENSSGAAGVTIRAAANFNSNIYFADPGSATIGQIEYRHNGDTMRFYTFGSEVMRNTSTGELMFNSGYGSVATAYGVRAWCRWNMNGTQSIYNSGNVSSLTDNGTGQTSVNFTTAMPDANYAVSGNRQYRGTFNFEGQTASLARAYSAETNGTLYDADDCTIIVVR